LTVAHVYTVAFQGIDAREVDVQVHIGDSGGGQFNIVGLADKAVGESRERVRAALAAIGLALPFKRITSIWRPPTCPRKARTMTCPSRWDCWRQWG
jgi:magnesium chelatase family protein